MVKMNKEANEKTWLRRAFDGLHEGVHHEIFLWRSKYLKERNYDDIHLEYFMSIPSSEFVKKEPEEHLNHIKRLSDRKQEQADDMYAIGNLYKTVRDSKEVS